MAGKKTKITHWVNNKNSLINWRALGNCEIYEKIISHRCLKSLNLGDKKLDNPITRYFFYFLILMVVSSALARNSDPPRTIIQGILFVYITYLATVSFANTKKRVFTLFNIFILGHLFIALRAIQDGGLIHGANLYKDQNIVALGMNILFPLVFFLGIFERKWRKKIFFYAISIIPLVALTVANSRGGIVGLVAIMLFIWFKSLCQQIAVGI